MTSRHRGAGSPGLIILILLLVVGAAVAAYFISAPLRTKTDEAFKQFAEWTPENIAKDPVNYLNFCETETKSAMESLEASKIAVAQKEAKLKGMLDEAQNKINVGEKALGELKAAYKTASAAGAWPMQWGGEDRTEDWAKRQIMSLHRQVESQSQVHDQVEKGLKQLEAQNIKIMDQKNRCEEQLATIASNREILKVQQITDDLKDQLVNMRGVVEATVAVTGSDPESIISLDQLASEAETTVDDEEFMKILNQ